MRADNNPAVVMPPGDDPPFVDAKIPTLSIAALPAIEAHQLWLMMNAPQGSGLAHGHTPAILRTIHTHEDTPAKVDGETMTRMLQFAQALVREVARSSASHRAFQEVERIRQHVLPGPC